MERKKSINLLPHHVQRIVQISQNGEDDTDYREYILNGSGIQKRALHAISLLQGDKANIRLVLDPRFDFVCNGSLDGNDVRCNGITNLSMSGCAKPTTIMQEIRLSKNLKMLPYKRYSLAEVISKVVSLESLD